NILVEQQRIAEVPRPYREKNSAAPFSYRCEQEEPIVPRKEKAGTRLSQLLTLHNLTVFLIYEHRHSFPQPWVVFNAPSQGGGGGQRTCRRDHRPHEVRVVHREEKSGRVVPGKEAGLF